MQSLGEMVDHTVLLLLGEIGEQRQHQGLAGRRLGVRQGSAGRRLGVRWSRAGRRLSVSWSREGSRLGVWQGRAAARLDRIGIRGFLVDRHHPAAGGDSLAQ
jgi:hypothetical protein